MSIKISGTGSALPERVLTNADLEKMVETSDAWILERTGISQRRIVENDNVVTLAEKACRAALQDAGKTPEDVELIIVATCTMEDFFPCAACQLQARLGAVHAAGFDVNAACSGFLYALATAHAYITAGLYRNALVVGGEVLSRLVDYEDRSSCILFGDGSGAVFVEKASEGKGLISLSQGCDGLGGVAISCKTDALDKIHMDGRAVYAFATRQVPLCIQDSLDKAGLAAEEIDLFLLHQANLRILETIAKRLNIPMEKVPHNLDRYGNISSATIPVLLDELKKRGKIKAGQKIVMAGFGAGLTYGSCVLIWE
ncbi:MAG: ketoacyl-ACP synthase III [Lachnospiraceae bacterium]|nr:ketoacyl-ACP synthase III [Lachnospiraceae bacterium]